MTALKLLLLHTAPNSRDSTYMKVVVKIVQRTNNEMFGINVFLGLLLWLLLKLFGILSPGSNIKALNFCINSLFAFQNVSKIVIL